MRLVNGVLGGLERAGLFRVSIRPERLQAKLRRKTGLDWQNCSFEEPLRILTNSLNGEAELHPFGRVLMTIALKWFLQNRLFLEHAWREKPEILSAPVRRPLYVIGLPRTGTTLLYNLLCQDPNCRPLMGWESFFPIRSPALKGRRPQRDTRKATGIRVVRRLNKWAPRLKSVHELVADGPEECTWILNSTFVSPGLTLQARMPSYEAYLRSLPSESWRGVYTHYADTLKVLQQDSAASHWVLKSPAHLMGLNELLDVIPDAHVVQTHRDVTKVIGSCCSLFSVVRGIYSDRVCEETLGPEVVEQLKFGVMRGLTARQDKSDRICDIGFEALVKDPIGTVKRIYERFGYPYDPQMEAGMRQWLKDNPQGKHGSHKYELSQFGLTETHVRDSFAEYQQCCDDARRG